VYESVNQHKYSRLANASYYFNNQPKNQQSFSKMPETRGFVLDSRLSNKEASVFVNLGTQEAVVAYRGTSNMKDVGTDLMVLTSTTGLSKRVRDSLKLMEHVLRKYRGFKVVSTGHSLGGMLSRIAGNTFALESHNFNPAESVHGSFQDQNGVTFNYRTHYDAVSILSKNSQRVSARLGNESTLESVHRLDNFYDKNAKRVVKDGEEVFEIRKSSKIYEHTAFLGTAVDIAVAGYDLKVGIQNKERPLEIADTITRDILPPNPVQLVFDSETGDYFKSIVHDEMKTEHHSKNFFQNIFQDIQKEYNDKYVSGSGYTAPPREVDTSTYREVMGQGVTPEIDRVNAHIQHRFRQ
jgi:predicted esterase YcpF (UPF0227 family)